MLDWGEKYAPSGQGERIRLVDRKEGRPVRPVRVLADDGRILTPKDVTVLPGEGTDDKLQDLINHRERRKS